jgi:hypothetical protein
MLTLLVSFKKQKPLIRRTGIQRVREPYHNSQKGTMDFSSFPSALESIQRRHPPLPQPVLDSCQSLNTIREPEDGCTPPILNILQTFLSEEVRWEALAVGLFLSIEILRPCMVDEQEKNLSSIDPKPHSVLNGPTLRSQLLPHDVLLICQKLHAVCLRHLEHPEPRIRTLLIQAVSVYAKSMPEEDDPTRVECQAQELQDLLWCRIKTHGGKEPHIGVEHATPFLETQWLCLASLIGALSDRYAKLLPTMSGPIVRTVEAVVSSSPHTNPHIRVAALQTIEQWAQAQSALDAKEARSLSDSSLYAFRSTVVTIIGSGLSDSSSLVRLAASVLCRTWFKSLQYCEISEEPSDMMSILLPRICFNRFDSALGVKLYSQESWKLLFPANDEDEDVPSAGLLAVVQYLPSVCQYYVQTCHKDQPPNIRSAAGAAICELIVRVGHHPVYRARLESHLLSFRQSLMNNIQDASLPVREAAGVALGALCKTFPEVMAEEWKTLWDLWTEQLTDPAGSEAAAVGLADLWEALDLENDRIRALIHQQLPRRDAHPESSRPGLDHPCDARNLLQGDGHHHGCPHCGRKVRCGVNVVLFPI